MFPQLARFTDLGLLLLRLMVGLVFITSIFLGIAKVSGALGLAFGVLTQVAAFGLIALMLGAIQKKIFSWHTGFWGEKTYGWALRTNVHPDESADSFHGRRHYVLLK